MRLNLKIGYPCVVVYRRPGDDRFTIEQGVVESVQGSGMWADKAFGRPAEGGKTVQGRAFENHGQAREWIAEQIEPVLPG